MFRCFTKLSSVMNFFWTTTLLLLFCFITKMYKLYDQLHPTIWLQSNRWNSLYFKLLHIFHHIPVHLIQWKKQLKDIINFVSKFDLKIQQQHSQKILRSSYDHFRVVERYSLNVLHSFARIKYNRYSFTDECRTFSECCSESLKWSQEIWKIFCECCLYIFRVKFNYVMIRPYTKVIIVRSS
jgi:hypothetical protein